MPPWQMRASIVGMTSTHDQAPAAAPRPRPGLRERVKARTRQELIDAAYELFAERGFDAVTVEDIAERADVSPRTFFRYFPVKEDVLLADLEDQTSVLVEALTARPASESPVTALREAIRSPMSLLVTRPVLCKVLALVKSTPSAQARNLAHRAEMESAIADVLAARMDVDRAADPRPLLIAATFMAGVGATMMTWVEDGSPDDLDDRLDAFAAMLRDGFGAAAPARRRAARRA